MNTTYLREAVFVSVCSENHEDGREPVVSMTKIVQCKDECTVMILHQHMGWTELEVKDCVTNDSPEEGHDMFFGSFQSMARDEENGLNLLYTEGPNPDAEAFFRRMRERLIKDLTINLPGDGSTRLAEMLRGLVPEQRESNDNVVPIGTGYGMYL